MTRYPDILTVQQANNRYIVRVGQSGAGSDDADLISIDTSGLANVDGDTIKEALQAIDDRLATLASSLVAGDYPIVANWKPRAFKLPATTPARYVEVIDDPTVHIHDKIVFDADASDHVAIVNADLPIGFVPGNFSLDLFFYTDLDGLFSADETDLYIASLAFGDADNVSPSYGADDVVTLSYPGASFVRSSVSVLLSSPNFSQADSLSFRLKVLGADANDFPVHITGAVLRRL